MVNREHRLTRPVWIALPVGELGVIWGVLWGLNWARWHWAPHFGRWLPGVSVYIGGAVFLWAVYQVLERWQHQGDRHLWHQIRQELAFYRQQQQCYATVHRQWSDYAQTQNVSTWQLYRLTPDTGALAFTALPVPPGDPLLNQDIWEQLLALENQWFEQEWITSRPLHTRWKEWVDEQGFPTALSSTKLPSM